MQENYNVDNNPVVWGGLQEHQCPRSDGVSPALTAAMGMGGGQTPIFTEREDKDMSKVGQISNEGSQCGSVFSDDGSMATLTAGTHGYANPHIYSNIGSENLRRWNVGGSWDSLMRISTKRSGRTAIHSFINRPAIVLWKTFLWRYSVK